MTLNEQLRRMKEASAAKMAPEVRAMVHQATLELAASGILDGVLSPGDAAPDFTLPDLTGNEVTLSGLLERGPAVLTFFRGRW